MCWVPCSSHGLLKINRNRQKTWQRREKKQTTWKDNKYQQIKKEMERSTMSKRKTNVTIWWGICWGWCPQKLNSLGSMLAFRCGFDGHTQGTQQVGGGEPGQGGAYRETKCGHQSSPKTSKWHIFSFTKCKGKLGSLNCFFCCFSAVPFPPTNVHSGSKLVFGFLEPIVCQKNSPDSTQAMIKWRNSWRMLGKTCTKCNLT